MNQASNNEVDLLLRSLAKGRDGAALRSGSASAGGNGSSPDHLDADELNSYAEGVVPAAARARYTEHLADCEACRRMVIDLSQAAGAANRLEVPVQQRGPGVWQKLTAVFSPAVLRFAVPALVLMAVIGIGLLARRSDHGSGPIAQNAEPVAQNEKPGSSTFSGQEKQADTASTFSSSPPQASIAKATASPNITFNDAIADKTNRLEKGADSPAPDLSRGVFGSATATKDGAAPGKAAEVAEARPYAPEPKAGAPAPATGAVVQSEEDAMTRAAKEQPAKREGERQRDQRDDYQNQPADVHGPNRGAAQKSGPYNNAQQNVAGVNARRSGPNAEDKKAKAKLDSDETRYVSGRRFAREDNAWIDTAYESSRGTINIKRGSEQFRALVADEPGLGAIADQLKGVVIVVWKDRAYRFH